MRLIWKSQSPVNAMKLISHYITDKEVESFLSAPYEHYHTFFDDEDKLLRADGVVNDLLAIDYKTFLADNNLVKMDRASMAVGLEAREPMLDHNLIEFLALLPSSLKLRNGVNKWMLKEIVHRYIPKRLMDRPKKPFIAPLMEWFKEDLKEQLKYYLSEHALQRSGVFKPEPILRLRNHIFRAKK